jgi:hypothetical protein
VTNTTNGVLTVASNFSASAKGRRALSTKGGYDLQDKTAVVVFSIDAATSTGNVVELWMYATTGKFIQAALSIVPGTLATTISVRFSGSSAATVQQQSTACAFSKQVQYQLKLRIYLASTWKVSTDLLQGSSTICTLDISPQAVPSNMFSDPFTYVLSQSSTGVPVQRANNAADEVMSIQINKMGVECSKGTCASVAPSPTQKASASGSSSVGLIAAIVSVIGGVVVLSVVLAVVVVAVIIKRKRDVRKTIYVEPKAREEEEVELEDCSSTSPTQRTYDAFRSK